MAIIFTLILASVFMFALAIASGAKPRPLRKRLARLGDGPTTLVEDSVQPGVLGDTGRAIGKRPPIRDGEAGKFLASVENQRCGNRPGHHNRRINFRTSSKSSSA